jgi:hypothetical protein
MKLWIKIVIGVVVAVILAGVLIPMKVIQGNAAAADLKKALLAQRLLDFKAAVLLQKGYEESQQGIIDEQGELEREAIEQRNELEDENARMAAEAVEEQKLKDAENEEKLARGVERREFRDNAEIPPSGNSIFSSGDTAIVKESSGGYESSRFGELELYLKSDKNFRYGSVDGQGLSVREWNDKVIRLKNTGQLEGHGELDNLTEVVVDVPNDLVWIRYNLGSLTLTELLPEKLWNCMEDAMGLQYCVPRNCKVSHSHLCISGSYHQRIH